MGLDQFKNFVKRKVEKQEKNNYVWIYTRVSSKDQESNKSLANQTDAGNRYAGENGYEINNTFGGLNPSVGVFGLKHRRPKHSN